MKMKKEIMNMLLNKLPHGGTYIYSLYFTLKRDFIKDENILKQLCEYIIAMDKEIKELQEQLIKAKQRALPDDFLKEGKQISFFIKDET